MSDHTPPLGPLPEPAMHTNGFFGNSVIPHYSADQMRDYALQERAAERVRIKSALIGMDDAAAGRHNYYAYAAWVLFERAEPGKDAA